MAAVAPFTAELLQGMLNKTFFVALRHPCDLARLPELLPSHVDWMINAEARGLIFASGPFVGEDSSPGSQGGLTIVRAGTKEEALEILSADPLVKEGVVTLQIHQWLVMEGGISVYVRFSNQSMKIC